MAIIQSGSAAGTALLVDPGFGAARATMRPMDSLGWHSASASTGNVANLAAGAALFSFRNASANPVVVLRVGFGFVSTTAFTTAQQLGFGLIAARNFTAADTGGTAIAFTGNNGKHRTALGTPTAIECRIALAAALGAGTRTLDANYLAMQAGWSGGASTVIAPSADNLLRQGSGNYPIVLAQNEGLVIANLVTMGAGGVGVGYVGIEFAEASAF